LCRERRASSFGSSIFPTYQTTWVSTNPSKPLEVTSNFTSLQFSEKWGYIDSEQLITSTRIRRTIR
jgi:hypothetical protein